VRLFIEVDGEPIQESPAGGDALVAFMSFAVARGFGAEHPLIALADRLHEVHGIRLGPLTTFYERATGDAEDEEKLEMAWQPAGPLREALSRAAAAVVDDSQIQSLARRAGIDEFAGALEHALAALPADDCRRVRLSYEL
jgi:hypothetical protein